MRNILLTGLGLAALSLSACSEKSADKVEQAGDAVGSDLERGINNADDHIQSGLKKTGDAVDRMGDDIGDAASDAARKADAQAAKAKQDAGVALEKAGKDLKN